VTRLSAGGLPKFRWNLGFSLSGDEWSVETLHRYLGGTDVQGAVKGVDPYIEVPDVAYWDLVGRYELKSIGLAIVAGIDNVLDTDPPFLPEGGQNAGNYGYDFVGRFFYTRLSYKY
jgi:outer membrane receptor protein involved in Fe transport